jgi:hypothetical protein
MDKKVYAAVRLRSEECCENCGVYCGCNLELHHILRRKVKATIDNTLMLCFECHRGTYGVHGMYGEHLDFKLKMMVQDLYISRNIKEEELRKLMGGKIYGQF